MKRIFILTIIFLVLCSTLSASGTKANNGYAPTTYETLSAQGAKDIKWIKINNKGSIVYETAKDGEEQPDDAIGYQYTDKKNKVITCYTTGEQQLVGKWINVLADTLDTITFRLVMAIHPFPSLMFQMYDTDSLNQASGYTMKSTEATGSFDTDYLLISNNFYNSSYLSNNKASNSNVSGMWKVRIAESTSNSDISEYTSYTGSSPYQHAKWSVVTVLFLTCFVAEMLFMTIYGYVTGNTENVLKEIAKKAGITLVLFILVSALPFLLESMRYGFCKIVDIFYAPVTDSYYSSLSLTASATDSGEIFQLPGSFLRQMKVFFTRTSSTDARLALSDAVGLVSEEFDGANFLVKFAVWILMLIFRIIMFFTVLKAALHIAVNIIEVYLLLGLTMVLVPFTCFEPLKPLGAKCIMSLITNLIECFVIMVLVVCVVPAVVSVCTDMLDNLSSYEDSETIVSWATITYSGDLYSSTGEVTDSKHSVKSVAVAANSDYVLLYMPTTLKYRVGLLYDFNYNGTGSYSVKTKLQNYMQALSLDYVFVMNSEYASTSSITLNELEKNIVMLPGGDQYKQSSVIPGSGQRSSFIDIARLFYDEVSSLKKNVTTISADYTQRHEFMVQLVEYLEKSAAFSDALQTVLYNTRMVDEDGQYKNQYAQLHGFSEPVSYTKANGTTTSTNNTNIHWLGQLLLCFMGMYIPVFFVQQSTQITNALMNGSAGMESFANSMGNAVHRTAMAAKSIASMPIQGVGGVVKTVYGSRMQAAETAKAAANQGANQENDESAASKLNKGN